MANYYSANSSNGAHVFTVPAQTTTSQVPVLPPAYSVAVTVKPSGCDCSFNKNNAIWLSCMLIAAGVMGIIGASIGLYVFAELAEIGTGLWCGLMFLSTGCVGLTAGHFKTIQLVRATVATTAFTIVFTVPLLTMSIIGLGSGANCSQFCYYPYHYCSCYSWNDMAYAANAVLIASATVALFFSLWLLIIAAICLRSMSKSQVSNLINPTMVTSPQLQQVVGSNPQQQPIVIFSNHSQPTVFLGQQMPQGVMTTLPQAQPFVVMGQQPVVMQGSQPQQPFVVFRQEPAPQGGAAVQSPGALYESLAVQNQAANGEQRRGNKNGDGDETGANM